MDPRLWLAIHVAQRIRTAILRHKLRKATRDGKITDCDLVIQEAYVNYNQLEGIARHVLTTLGGSLVAAGYVNDAQLTALVGGLLAVGGVVWSVWQKRKSA